MLNQYFELFSEIFVKEILKFSKDHITKKIKFLSKERERYRHSGIDATEISKRKYLLIVFLVVGIGIGKKVSILQSIEY